MKHSTTNSLPLELLLSEPKPRVLQDHPIDLLAAASVAFVDDVANPTAESTLLALLLASNMTVPLAEITELHLLLLALTDGFVVAQFTTSEAREWRQLLL